MAGLIDGKGSPQDDLGWAPARRGPGRICAFWS